MKAPPQTDAARLIQQFGDDVYLDENHFSEITNIPVPTLRTWRSRESGPPFVKIGKRTVRYHWGGAKAYFAANTFGRSAGSDAPRAA